MEPYRLEASFLNAINDACVANGIVMPGPSYGVTVSPTPAPVAFNAQVSGTTASVPSNLQAPSPTGQVGAADPSVSAKAIGQVPPAQHVPPAQAAAIIGVPQSMIENPPPKKEKEE